MINLISSLFIDFDEIWWGLSSSLMKIINMLEQAFTFVVGAGGDFTAGDNSTSMNGEDNLLVRTFLSLFGSNGSMRKVYFSMIILCMGLMIVFVFVGVIKAQFSKDATESVGKMVSKGFWSIFKMLLVPVFFFISLVLVGFIFEKIIELMGGGGERASLAETICRCFTDDPDINFDSSYDVPKIQASINAGHFNFVLCILTSGCLIVTLATATIAVTKRFVKIFFYYVTAPMVLSKSMIDEGKSWELWKDNLLAQLLGAGGVIIAMYIFIAVVPSIAQIIDDTIPSERFLLASILKIVFIFGMSTVPAGASALMAQLVSQGAGQNESNDLMHTQQMLGNGLKLAGAVAGKAMAGGLAAMTGGGGGFAARMGGGAAAAGAAQGAGAMNAAPTPALSGASGGGTTPSAGGMAGAAGGAAAAAGGGSPASPAAPSGGASPSDGGMAGAAAGGAAASAGGASPASFSASGGASPSDGGAGAAGAASGAAAGLNGAIQRNAQAGGLRGALAKNVARHRGGSGFAIMRGGVLGAIGYGLTRGVSLLGSAAKYGIGKAYDKLGGAKHKAKKADKAALKADSKANKKAAKAQAKANNLGAKDIQKAMGSGSSQQANANRYFEAQFQKLARQGQRVNHTLNSGKMKYASDAQKDQYRQNRMQANISRLQNQMKIAGMSGNAAMQKRFAEAVKGNAGGNGGKK